MKETDSSLRQSMAARHDEMVALRGAGLSYAEIGSRFGVTRERVRQILFPAPRRLPAHKRMPKPEPMLTTREASRLLAVHPNTLRRWTAEGIIKVYRIGSRNERRFRREDIDAFIEGHSQTAHPFERTKKVVHPGNLKHTYSQRCNQ